MDFLPYTFTNTLVFFISLVLPSWLSEEANQFRIDRSVNFEAIIAIAQPSEIQEKNPRKTNLGDVGKTTLAKLEGRKKVLQWDHDAFFLTIGFTIDLGPLWFYWYNRLQYLGGNAWPSSDQKSRRMPIFGV